MQQMETALPEDRGGNQTNAGRERVESSVDNSSAVLGGERSNISCANMANMGKSRGQLSLALANVVAAPLLLPHSTLSRSPSTSCLRSPALSCAPAALPSAAMVLSTPSRAPGAAVAVPT